MGTQGDPTGRSMMGDGVSPEIGRATSSIEGRQLVERVPRPAADCTGDVVHVVGARHEAEEAGEEEHPALRSWNEGRLERAQQDNRRDESKNRLGEGNKRPAARQKLYSLQFEQFERLNLLMSALQLFRNDPAAPLNSRLRFKLYVVRQKYVVSHKQRRRSSS